MAFETHKSKIGVQVSAQKKLRKKNKTKTLIH